MQIAFAGSDAMERGMAGRLIGAGHELVGYDPAPAGAEWLTARGAQAAESVAAACRGAQALVVMVVNAGRRA